MQLGLSVYVDGPYGFHAQDCSGSLKDATRASAHIYFLDAVLLCIAKASMTLLMEASVAFVAGNVFLLYLSWIVTGVVYFQGVSLRTMYRQLADSGPCVMIVEDTQMWTFKGFKEKLYLYIEGNGKAETGLRVSLPWFWILVF